MTVERSKRRFLIPIVFITKCFKKPLLLSITKVAVKLNYWQGKDSLKEKSYLTDEGRQKPGPRSKMRLIDEFLMVMMRLKLLEQDLADRFCVSTTTVSRTLLTWYPVLADHLR